MRYLRHALVTALLLAFLSVPAVAEARHVPYVVGVSGRYAVSVIHRSGWKAYVARNVYSTRYARYRVVSQATHGGTVTITCSLGRPPTYSWHTAQASFFGGPGDYQPTRYGNTRDLIARGRYFFADRSKQFGKRIAFRRPGHSKVVIATLMDYGPATWTGRRFDLGYNVARALGYDCESVLWSYVK